MESTENKIVYYVAISIDGFISGEDDDISGFLPDGNGVQKYMDDLKAFKTVIMGRRTYEFGYKFGLRPGEAPYPHMDHHIFSNTLHLDNAAVNVQVKKPVLWEIDNIKKRSITDVYLCGGGIFAGWLLDNGRIDILKLKINPLILGKGIRLFGNSEKRFSLELITSETYDDGLLINTYNIK